MNNLSIIEYQSQRVLTTQQIADAYETDPQLVVNNFNRNRDRYTNGKHFYCMEGEMLREFRAKNQIDLPLNLNKFYLWTEKGAWLHAKSLGTDKAWNAYEMLVDDYYDIKSQSCQAPMTIEDMIICQAQSVKDLKIEMEAIGVTSEYAKEQSQLAHRRIDELDAVDPAGTPRQQLSQAVRRYAERNGLQYSAAWGKFREAYNMAFATNIQTLANHYKMRNDLKALTIPEYLEAVGKIEDALRVTNKMLQRREFSLA